MALLCTIDRHRGSQGKGRKASMAPGRRSQCRPAELLIFNQKLLISGPALTAPTSDPGHVRGGVGIGGGFGGGVDGT